MNYYINVKFGNSNKTYYFATDDITLQIGEKIVVETIVGLELAEIATAPQLLETLNFDREIKPILRRATVDDLKAYQFNLELSESASKIFNKHIDELKLDMRLLGTQYTLDRSKVLFTYVADDRVDFRELLKLLASDLHCRIELKQVNARERAQLVGGLGVCGLPLCCTTFFTQFEGVSLNKAKNQMLSINIPKLSGQCGKLMCCLKYEDDYYTEIKKEYPPINTKVHYQDADFKITSFNIFTKIIKLQNSNDVIFLTLDEVNGLLKNSPIKRNELPLDKNPIVKEKNPVTTNETKRDELINKTKNTQKVSDAERKAKDEPKQKDVQKQPQKQSDNKKKDDSKQKTKRQNHHQKQSEQPKKNHQNNKKPANREHNASQEQNFEANSNKFLFAGQANKVKEYQETYAKNNPDKNKKQKPHSNHSTNKNDRKANVQKKQSEGKK